LLLHLSRSFARTLRPGDEVVVTRLDHDANVRPWVLAAADAGATVRWVDVRDDDVTIDADSFDAALSERARAHRVEAQPLSGYYLRERPKQGFVLGYAAVPERSTRAAVLRLAEALREGG